DAVKRSGQKGRGSRYKFALPFAPSLARCLYAFMLDHFDPAWEKRMNRKRRTRKNRHILLQIYITRISAPRSRIRALGLGLALAVASTLGLAKQVGELPLIVTVVDFNRSVLPSAQVSLDGSGGFRQTLLTNQQGMVIFIKLLPGRYRLRVEAGHFEPHEQEITLEAGGRRITVRLDVARIKEEIV